MSSEPKCQACDEPVTLERGITVTGDLNAPGVDYYCEPCAPNRGKGYTLSDLQRMREGEELGPGLHKVGENPWDYVYNPAKGQRVTSVDVDGRTHTGIVTDYQRNRATGEIQLTVQPEWLVNAQQFVAEVLGESEGKP